MNKKEVVKLNKAQQALLDLVVKDLNDGVVPWQKPWLALDSPKNAINHHSYRGDNQLYLSLVMLTKEYSDPRFLTFKQMQSHNKGLLREEQIYLPKGTKGYPISYSNFYSRELKRNLTAKDFKEWTQNQIQEKIESKEIYFYTKGTTVFHISQFEGPFPSYKSPMERKSYVDLDLIHGVADRMMLKLIVSERNSKAFYTPSRDSVSLPAPELFYEDIGFYRTTFHEFAHATGHSSRLNRELRGRGDIESYAKEELRAEISSLFLSQKIELPLSENHIEQGSAYIGSWLEALDNDPGMIFKAAKDASKIEEYLYGKVKEYENSIQLKEVQTDEKRAIRSAVYEEDEMEL